MNITLHKHFKKDYLKLSKSQKERFKERRNTFIIDEFHPILNNHPLKGTFEGYRSFNVSGDLRVLYKKTVNEVFFIRISTHSELYR